VPRVARPILRRHVIQRRRSVAAGRRGFVGQHDHVEAARQIARIQRLRVHALVRELVSLEQPARPAAAGGTAVAIPQSDSDRLETERVRCRRRRDADEGQTEVEAALSRIARVVGRAAM
jgi:hypothetical protein